MSNSDGTRVDQADPAPDQVSEPGLWSEPVTPATLQGTQATARDVLMPTDPFSRRQRLPSSRANWSLRSCVIRGSAVKVPSLSCLQSATPGPRPDRDQGWIRCVPGR